MDVFESLRGRGEGARFSAPCVNTWIGVDRVIVGGTVGLFFRRNHDCGFENDPLAADLIVQDVARLGLDVLRVQRHRSGMLTVVTTGCPGVRLRAIMDATRAEGARLPEELIAFLVRKSMELRAVCDTAALVPGDTFVGFDGSVHLMPHLQDCWRSEMPSWFGTEVFDAFVASDAPADVSTLRTGALPEPMLVLAQREALVRTGHAPVPATQPDTGHFDELTRIDPPESTIGRTRGQSLSQWLGALARGLFPDVYERHRRVYEELGMAFENEGLQREERVLAGTTCGPSPGRVRGTVVVDTRPMNNGQVDAVLRRGGGPREDTATMVTQAEAVRVATHLGRRLLGADEWIAAVDTVDRAGPWEWTNTRHLDGFVVLGGRWRNRPGEPASPQHRSHEDQAAGDLGFRCALDIDLVDEDDTIDDAYASVHYPDKGQSDDQDS